MLIVNINDIQVAIEGRLVNINDLTVDQLREIYDNHKKQCSVEELDLVLGSDDPIPPDRIHLHVLRKIDRFFMNHSIAAEEAEALKNLKALVQKSGLSVQIQENGSIFIE